MAHCNLRTRLVSRQGAYDDLRCHAMCSERPQQPLQRLRQRAHLLGIVPAAEGRRPRLRPRAPRRRTAPHNVPTDEVVDAAHLEQLVGAAWLLVCAFVTAPPCLFIDLYLVRCRSCVSTRFRICRCSTVPSDLFPLSLPDRPTWPPAQQLYFTVVTRPRAALACSARL